ncbi:DoxX family protein [Galbibacter sp. BG1]|uniref:MauE/DoxX family redox-associated membrane protein n=1 Tax=Galbibacter sp. BG1 TaxID=1170699 RepID=UPI0015BF1A8A|nr:DoxX family protein [Galbibacter sp. BG1]QLE01119.1 DoxX family protein [Galbibacter sp. BG1]
MEVSKDLLPVIALLIFIGITFLFSFWDKVSSWGGNTSFLRNHFQGTFVKHMVPISLWVITVLELVAGVGAILGIFYYVAGDKELALYSVCIALLVLFIFLIGQRIAKDFDGAMKIVVYLIPTMFCLYLLTQ